MEVKINKEIREYTETIFFGLSLRQFIFSVLACAVAVLLYFLLKPHFGLETLSWVCILGAFPFAILGFVKYNGMTAEKFVWAWIKSVILIPKKLVFKPVNLYNELLKNADKEKNSKNAKKEKQHKSKKKNKNKKSENIKKKEDNIENNENFEQDI